jgi:hypothetical protein
MECQRPQQVRTPPPRPPPPGATAAAGAESDTRVSDVFKSFQQLHDKAFAKVEKGLNADSEGDLTAAERYYTEGFALLERILDVDCENLPGASASEKDQAKLMQQKMNKTKWQVTYRLEALRGDTHRDQASASGFTELPAEQPQDGVRLPSYDEAVSSGPTSMSSVSPSSLMSDATLGDSIMAAEYPNLAGQRQSMHGTELFSVDAGVQIFHITPEGFVSAPSYPSALHIVKLEEGEDGRTESQEPPAFLQVRFQFCRLLVCSMMCVCS